jgi:hypothetical protein
MSTISPAYTGFAASPTFSGVAKFTGGTSTAGSAPVIASAFASGVASQLADLTRDYMVYLVVATAGSAFTVAIGPTSGAVNVIVASETPAAGMAVSVRLPAGWFLEWAGTLTTLDDQIAIGC